LSLSSILTREKGKGKEKKDPINSDTAVGRRKGKEREALACIQGSVDNRSSILYGEKK